MCAHGNGTFGFNDFRFRLFFSLTLFHHRNGRLHKNNEEKYIVQVHFCTRALTRHEEHRKTGNTREWMEPWSVHREHWTPSSIFRWCITLNESIWPFRSHFFSLAEGTPLGSTHVPLLLFSNHFGVCSASGGIKKYAQTRRETIEGDRKFLVVCCVCYRFYCWNEAPTKSIFK